MILHFGRPSMRTKALSSRGTQNSNSKPGPPARHAKVTTTLDLYSQSVDASKLNAQKDMAMAITGTAVAAD